MILLLLGYEVPVEDVVELMFKWLIHISRASNSLDIRVMDYDLITRM